ncbi:hypothetical protein SGGMMB4_02547 [Sodalis glossinidius str. 'morsitans']|uniref:Uncharacterized protein n=1 Tax=Sodalis glossinidius (strain morsitans) TaxID=343509 RepID=A0A193QIQ7_SODGM|nr:DUF1374 domain-containing protein [Sodalis glossinidius]CRL45051.1 hypothetical protein SGGMMB4_02547 [Sodalis glossinidius str. 'morsitans']
MMQLNKPRITAFNHPHFGEMVTVTDGSNNINDSRCWMSIEEYPYDNQETMIYKSIIGYLMEKNQRLKKQVHKLKRVT